MSMNPARNIAEEKRWAKKNWDNNRHTVLILKHLLWPHQVYWCEKCQKHVSATRTPGEVYALEYAIRKLGGRVTKQEREFGHIDIEVKRRTA